ncbi:hypothetical protein FEM48_Zijuj01G0158500 [Ziziphus jujuba var. spinosa]|uniref:Malectin-like domain-containing protein n=1 Tax=Ziziphus jujuba var. spinosa TaxID=714518 RepID=A0A978W256_ZIZJJ|nr:hypothetical protein FEM48_Zijuj01G0158500 [Ziziphus jujuba var. spinosa]
MPRFLLLWLLVLCLTRSSFSARPEPFALRISCGARENVHTPPTNTLWFKDFAYSGGIPANATAPSYVTPPLKTLRYFPLSVGSDNCYNIERVPKGHYAVRIFFGLVAQPKIDNEPLFDVSVEGTLINSLKSGWSSQDDQAFAEALVFLTDKTVSLCFHSTGHGDPSILSIEILQVDNKVYNVGQQLDGGVILRTVKRLNCGTGKPKFDADYNGDRWGGDRFWKPISTFSQSSDRVISVESKIKHASEPPNFYPEGLYQTAIVGTDSQPELAYTIEVDPNRNYSVWLHFAEIDPSISAFGQRVFDILINGDIAFENVDIAKISGGLYVAVVLNTTVTINGRTLTVVLQPKKGAHGIISAIEVFEVVIPESKTLAEEVRALQTLKKALGLPLRLGWNGDPCVPQQHPWSGADCQFDRTSMVLTTKVSKVFWLVTYPDCVIYRACQFLSLHLDCNLSGNTIHGAIPSSLGTITSLEVLDLSYNSFNGSIPDSLGQLKSLQTLNLNGNFLVGKVPVALGGRLLHRASFNFTDNAGLCGIPGLPSCGHHLTAGQKVGIVLGALTLLLLIVLCSICWWKRRQNILRAQQIAAREAPYAKARTHLSRDIQMSRNQNHPNARTAAENGPILLS